MSTSTERVIVLGATGFTGRLVAEAVLRRGGRPVLAARDPTRLDALAREFGAGLETRVADIEHRDSVASLAAEGDVIVTTVGPFARFGDLVAEAAIDAGAHYLDSSGEPSFTRRIFELYGPRAESAGTVMLSAFATEWVLGSVAGGLALEKAGPAAVRVDTGYFLLRADASRTIGLASLARIFGATSFASGVALFGEPGFAWRDGRLVGERFAKRLGTFEVDHQRLRGLSAGGTEHFALPRAFPHVREVNVYFGWFDAASRALQVVSAVAGGVLRAPFAQRFLQDLLSRAKGSRGGPSAAGRAGVRSLTVGAAYDEGGRELARVLLHGPELYGLTAEFLAWGALRIAEGSVRRTGALGPIEAFGLAELRECCEAAGVRVASG